MRFHGNITRLDLNNAAREAGVGILDLTEHRSRSHARAFNFALTGSSNRRTQWRNGGDDQAATWDEWGIFLAVLFDRDPAGKATYYRDAADFHWQTGDRFRTLAWTEQHRQHRWDFQGHIGESECHCGAKQRRPAVAA